MKLLRKLKLIHHNNRKISRAVRKGILFSALTVALAAPATASAGAPVFNGLAWSAPGEGYIYEVKAYGKWADFGYIRLSYPYWGAWAEMNGPYWNSAASGGEQKFAYAAKWNGCSPIRFQVDLTNYSAPVYKQTGYINVCTYTGVTEG